jgi:hypothetical protein
MWDVPVFPIKKLKPEGDSAVVLYWEPKELPPGQSREVGFAYGVGSVSGKEGKGKLALTVGGSFRAGEAFTATAYVTNPQPGDKVTLTLPDGFELEEGDATQTVPDPPRDSARRVSPVSWKITAPKRKGSYDLRVKLSSGATQRKRVRITTKNLFGN